jgi:hypothetical protein
MVVVVEAQGAVFNIGNEDVPLTYTVVGRVTNINGIGGGQATVIDTTDLSSTHREFIMGLADEGEITIDLNFDPTDSGQDKLSAARNSRQVQDFQVVLNDVGATTFTFQGFVLSFSKDIAIDSQISGSASIRITGAVTES